MPDPFAGTKVGLDGVRRDEESPDFPTEVPKRPGTVLTSGSDAGQVVASLTEKLTRSIDDAVVIVGDATLVSATAAFGDADLGAKVENKHVPAGAVIDSVTNSTTVELSVEAEDGAKVKYTDGATTNDSKVVTSAGSAFTSALVGAAISGTGIAGGTTIARVISATSLQLSANATSTGTGRTHTITPVGYSADASIEREASVYIGTLEDRIAALEA